ncbi:MAG: hypothetical protein KFB94_02820 [Methylophilaceae bacterium]|jgi:hypothetical protein|nr:MAG: hypothetical protein KFB94_02820 [Methylophilaceae bacterium]
MKLIAILCILLLNACANSPVSKYPIPDRPDKTSINQLAKADFDRMADMELESNTQSLRTLMMKLYKRNPLELAKSNVDSAEKMTASVFDEAAKHQWRFSQLQNKQDVEAIFLAFDPHYQHDRVLAFIVGLQTMLAKAHNNKTSFYLTDTLDPQHIYNAARNIEIAAWKLSNSRDANGNLYLLTNEINEKDRNLSFEREFGKMIGRTDFYAIALAEKSQRLISRIAQSLASAVFLPF